MRIAVYGAGGVGGYLGGRLAQSGEDVVLIARGEHLQAIQKHGLKVESVKGDFVSNLALATENPDEVGAVAAGRVARMLLRLIRLLCDRREISLYPPVVPNPPWDS